MFSAVLALFTEEDSGGNKALGKQRLWLASDQEWLVGLSKEHEMAQTF